MSSRALETKSKKLGKALKTKSPTLGMPSTIKSIKSSLPARIALGALKKTSSVPLSMSRTEYVVELKEQEIIFVIFVS